MSKINTNHLNEERHTTAFGQYNTVVGGDACAIGSNNHVRAKCSLAVGEFNDSCIQPSTISVNDGSAECLAGYAGWRSVSCPTGVTKLLMFESGAMISGIFQFVSVNETEPAVAAFTINRYGVLTIQNIIGAPPSDLKLNTLDGVLMADIQYPCQISLQFTLIGGIY